MASKGSADRTHKPSGPEHYSPQMEKRIERRAIVGLTMAGVPNEMAKRIVKTPLGTIKA